MRSVAPRTASPAPRVGAPDPRRWCRARRPRARAGFLDPDAPGIAASRGRTARAAGRPPHAGPCRSAFGPDSALGGRRCAALALRACAGATRPAGSPRTSSRSSRSPATPTRATVEPDYNVAPTKEVYAVVERPPRDEDGTQAEPAGAPAAGADLGAGAVLGQGPQVGSRMINARMETVAEKPAYRRAFERRRCLLPADGYYEWYPTERADGEGRQAAQAAVLHPPGTAASLAMAGLYEIWRDPTKAEDDPDRFRWTCTVLTTEAEDSLGHIHDRMPLMVEPDAYDAWLDPRSHDRDRCSTCWCRPRRAGSRRTRSRPLVSNVRNNGPELVEPLPLRGPAGSRGAGLTDADRERHASPTPQGEARLVVRRRARRPGRDAGAQPRRRRRHRRPRPGARWPTRLPRHGITVVAARAAVAGRRQQGRAPRRPCSTSASPPRSTAAADCAAPLVVGGRSAGARSAVPDRRRELGAPWAAWRSPSRCTRPAGRRSRGSTSCWAPGADAGGPGRARHVRRGPRSSPRDVDRGRRARRRPRLQGAEVAPALTQADALAVVVEATLEWLVREVAGNRG